MEKERQLVQEHAVVTPVGIRHITVLPVLQDMLEQRVNILTWLHAMVKVSSMVVVRIRVQERVIRVIRDMLVQRVNILMHSLVITTELFLPLVFVRVLEIGLERTVQPVLLAMLGQTVNILMHSLVITTELFLLLVFVRVLEIGLERTVQLVLLDIWVQIVNILMHSLVITTAQQLIQEHAVVISDGPEQRVVRLLHQVLWEPYLLVVLQLVQWLLAGMPHQAQEQRFLIIIYLYHLEYQDIQRQLRQRLLPYLDWQP
jgi:hypothetical protein